MGKRRYCYGEVLPFSGMIFVQCVQVGISTFFKAASTDGMSSVVFMVYSFVLSSIVLLPLALIFDRKKNLPPFNLSVFWRFCLLGFLGALSQSLGFTGIEYSSPTMASAMGNLTPAFTFVLAVFFRMEKLQIKSLSSQAKILGTVLSITGATVMVLYEGPVLIRTVEASALGKLSLSSPQSSWLLGGVFLCADFFLISVWYIVQAQTIMIYPAEFLIVFGYYFSSSIMSAPIAYFLERDISAWKLNSPTKLYAVLYSGLLGTSIGTTVITWGLHLKGPVYVTLFTPLSILVAAVMGFIFLGDPLHLGSVIGAAIISVGFYICMWGKVKEELVEELVIENLESGSAEQVPLLQ